MKEDSHGAQKCNLLWLPEVDTEVKSPVWDAWGHLLWYGDGGALVQPTAVAHGCGLGPWWDMPPYCGKLEGEFQNSTCLHQH